MNAIEVTHVFKSEIRLRESSALFSVANCFRRP